MSSAGARVTLFGGSGFIGRRLSIALRQRGVPVRIVSRHRPAASPGSGDAETVHADLHRAGAAKEAASGSAIVINMIRVCIERDAQMATAVGADDAVAQSAAENGARLIYLSTIGADPAAPALYAQWKGQGEANARKRVPGVAILRPSVVFGPGDNIVNRFAGMARSLPILPLVGGGRSRMQPVYVEDVVDAILAAIDGRCAPGAFYELGGPEVMTLKDLLEFIFQTIKRRPPLVPVPYPVATMLGMVLQRLPRPPITVDQVRLLRRDNVVSDWARREGLTLEGLGIRPRALAQIVPGYLRG